MSLVRGCGIAFYLSYIHFKIMCVVPIERAWEYDSNHTKYSKLSSIDLRGFKYKAT